MTNGPISVKQWKALGIHTCVGYDQLSNVLFLYFWCFKIYFYVITTFWHLT